MYNILIRLGISMKLVRLIKICLNETYVSDAFPIPDCLKQGDVLSIALHLCGRICQQEGPIKPERIGIEWKTSFSGLR